MTEQHFKPDTGKGILTSVDLRSADDYAAITNTGEIITPYRRLDTTENLLYPIIRMLPDGHFLTAGARCKGNNNAVIYDPDGKVIRSFFAGDGIEDIRVVQDKIVCTYFDQGVYGDTGPNNEGVAVFDLEGKLLFGFNGAAGEDLIADCYAICLFDNRKILFYPYTDFPLVELNTDTFQWKMHPSPPDFTGSGAMTCKYGQIIFHASYHDKTSFYRWDIWQKKGGEIRALPRPAPGTGQRKIHPHRRTHIHSDRRRSFRRIKSTAAHTSFYKLPSLSSSGSSEQFNIQHNSTFNIQHSYRYAPSNLSSSSRQFSEFNIQHLTFNINTSTTPPSHRSRTGRAIR